MDSDLIDINDVNPEVDDSDNDEDMEYINDIDIDNSEYVSKIKNPSNRIIIHHINNLKKEMLQYQEDVKSIWEKHIKNFLMSTDCVTIKLYPSYYESFDKFMNFMMKQPTYQIMMMILNRLQQRL